MTELNAKAFTKRELIIAAWEDAGRGSISEKLLRRIQRAAVLIAMPQAS